MKTQTGIKATKAVLFAAALVTAVVAVYTTWALFTNPELGLQFSPEDVLSNRTNGTNATGNDSDGVSFVFQGDCSNPDFAGNVTNETCNTSVIPPAPRDSPPEPGVIGFLATLDIAHTPNGLGVVVLIVIEIIVVFIVYRELDIFLHEGA